MRAFDATRRISAARAKELGLVDFLNVVKGHLDTDAGEELITARFGDALADVYR